MSEKASLLSVYKLLPQTNCGECGEANCMAFASRLLERSKPPEDCKPMIRETRYKKNFAKLVELVAPPIREVIVGVGDRAVKIGGEEVLYRHQLTYYNPTAIAVDLSDNMSAEEIKKRCKAIDSFSVQKIGQELKLDMIAVRAASGDPDRFASAVKLVAETSNFPIILCSYDHNSLKAAVESKGIAERRPLLYAANKDNWKEVGELAKKHNCPVVVSSPNDMDTLASLSSTLESMGLRDIILDPGTLVEGGLLKDTVNNLVMLRRAGFKKTKSLGYPILVVPAVVWATENPDPVTTSYRESYIASLLLNRYADIMVMRTLDIWAMLPVVTLRQSIYTDPRKPVSVDAALKPFGTPNETSPVLITSNFALTYFTVANDIESSTVDCYLIVTDAEGLAVEVGVSGGQFTAAGINDILTSTNVANRVKHKRMVIPGKAARLKGEIEDVTGWEVMVGPQDSSQIKDFLKKHWEAPKQKT
ncbi:MAG: acetyl-CoA decarbonylase/synthase complex subunit gamma [Nitrososphaerales archaeon]